MGDIGRIFNTARDAISANLTAMNVTGSNIANVNTPGYSRLRPDFGSIGVFNAASDQQQVGVKITSVERLYDKYLDQQVVQQEQYGAYSQSQLDVLNNVQTVFNESTGGGINDLLSQFWGAWSQLSANPSGITERDSLVSVSQSLASMFNQKANELINIQNDTNNEISSDVTKLNTDLAQLADYNDKIIQIQNSGGTAADLCDKRTELLKNISQIADVNYYEEKDGSVNVYISNGRSLVEGTNVWNLNVKANPNNSNYYDIVFADAPNQVINGDLKGGQLAGLIDVRDNKVAGYLNDLNSMASTIITKVNALNSSGYDLNGNAGGNFFSTTSTLAKDMQVDSSIVADVRKIAAGTTVNGDGDNASSIAALQNDASSMGSGMTIDNFYESLTSRVGQDVVNAQNTLDHQTSVMNQLENQRDAVSGVSLDEEMLNLIKYQAAYNAAGRLVATVNTMMNNLINLGIETPITT
ncbi:MAG: flagellar hook-associated protein FlgK [Syntrophales bacterium]